MTFTIVSVLITIVFEREVNISQKKLELHLVCLRVYGMIQPLRNGAGNVLKFTTILTPSVTCGMCQGTEARYVHVMRHPRAANLSVGCICAGYMEGYFDEIGKEIVKQREEQLRNRTQRRGKWLTRKWGETRNGNPKLKIEGQIIAVFPRRDGYSFMIDGEFSDQQYPTEDEAKLGAFDFLFPSRIRV